MHRDKRAIPMRQTYCMIKYISSQHEVSTTPPHYFYLSVCMGTGQMWRSEDNVWETSVSLFCCVRPRDWIQVVRLRRRVVTCWAKSLAPMFLSDPEIWDTPLTSAFWHLYPFSFLTLSSSGPFSPMQNFPVREGLGMKRMGRERANLLSVQTLTWSDLAKWVPWIHEAR